MSQKKIVPQPIGIGNLPPGKNQQVKSMKSTPKSHKENPEKLTQTSSKTCMQLIFQANKQYLMDKIQISQIPKPSKYYHKIPSKTPNTTYNNQFHKINAHMMNQLKLERKDNLYNLKDNVSGYQSLYCQNFGDNQRSKSLAVTNKKQNLLKKENPKYQPNQAPAFLQTSYSLNFVGNYNPIPAQSTKMKECKLMGGGKFQGQTTYHGVFKNYESKKQQPIHQTNNKIFMTIDTPKETTYEKEFNSRKASKSIKKSSENQQKSSRKRVSSEMVQASKEMQKKKFKSEYERSFQTIQPPSGRNTKKVSLMSLQQMKTLILNSL